MMTRVVQPEWLDGLAADLPEARASRGDLRRLNWIMRHRSLIHAAWRSAEASDWASRLVDLGGGDGRFLLELVSSMPSRKRLKDLVLVDRQPVVSNTTLHGFETLGLPLEIIASDMFDWLGQTVPERDTFMFANLFLHHFERDALYRLLSLASGRCDAFVAIEPSRSAPALAASRLVGCIGCNAVTRHDAVVSVKAGFRGNEISALWPAGPQWTVCERPAGLFSHAFVATRQRG